MARKPQETDLQVLDRVKEALVRGDEVFFRTDVEALVRVMAHMGTVLMEAKVSIIEAEAAVEKAMLRTNAKS